jgi:ribose transport system permease protein
MFVVYAFNQPAALTQFGMTNLLNNTIVLAVAASGLTLVVLSAELDLSGIGVIALCNVLVATTSGGSFGAWGSLIAVLALGGAIGLANGLLVVRFGLQSLAVTLGTLIICQGAALLVLPAPGGMVVDAIAYGLTGDVYGLPVAGLFIIGIAVLWRLFLRSRPGIALYAVGADASAARLSGLNVDSTKLLAFGLAGVAYGMAGYLYSAQIASGDPRISDALLLFMFASVAIGGTSLNGGRGGILGTLIGAYILTVMQKMLFALGVAEFYTNIFNGIIMLVAIFFGQLSNVLARRSTRSAA